MTATPTRAVTVQQVGQDRIYNAGRSVLWTEQASWSVAAGLYYFQGECGGDGSGLAEATLLVQQLDENGEVYAEPYRDQCGPANEKLVFGQTRRLDKGTYRLDIQTNAYTGLRVEIQPGSQQPALPPGKTPPAPPTGLRAVRTELPCPGEIVVGDTSPCVVFDLSWTPPAKDPSVGGASYRLYEAWDRIGTTPMPGSPADAELFDQTAGPEPRVWTANYGTSAGWWGLCLFVSSVNSAGESALVKFAGTNIQTHE